MKLFFCTITKKKRKERKKKNRIIIIAYQKHILYQKGKKSSPESLFFLLSNPAFCSPHALSLPLYISLHSPTPTPKSITTSE